MSWKTISPYCIESHDGTVRVSKSGVNGSARYTRWELDDGAWLPVLVTDDVKEAKGEAHGA